MPAPADLATDLAPIGAGTAIASDPAHATAIAAIATVTASTVASAPRTV